MDPSILVMRSLSPEVLEMKRSFLTATVASLILVVCLFLLNCHRTVQSGDQAYFWVDDAGMSYLTVQSKDAVSPDGFLPKDSGLTTEAVSVKAPVRERVGFKITTYRLSKPVQRRFQLIEKDSAPRIFLVGETHLGKSQKQVASVLCRLFREHEIDAVFVEQPDDLKYDWSKFERLADNPRRTIAAMQYRMLADADQILELTTLNFGKYDKYFKRGDMTSEDGVKQILMNIFNDYGETGLQEAEKIMDHQLAIFKASTEAYERSEYISATDYLYVLLNVMGVRVPFYNVDSVGLRKEFTNNAANSNNLDLDPRDKYMTDKIKTTVTTNGYRQMILVCGALHLKNQERNFTQEGYQTETSYNALSLKNLKNPMAVLAKPEYVINLAKEGPPIGFEASDLYTFENVPSSDLLSNFNSYFSGEEIQGFSEAEIDQLRRSFEESYRKQNLKDRASWSIDLSTSSGTKLTLSKDVKSNSFTITTLRPADSKFMQNFEATGPNNHVFDFKNSRRVEAINQQHPSIRLFTVEDKLTHYEVYSGPDGPILNDNGSPNFTLPELIKTINSQLGPGGAKSIYLDTKGLSDDKLEGFATTARIQQWQQNDDVSIFTLPRPNEMTDLQDAIFSPRVVFDKTLEPEVWPINEGPQKGWFQVTLHFISEVGGKVVKFSIEFITKSNDIAQELLQSIRTRVLASAGPNARMSLPDIVSVSCIEMRKKYKLPADQLQVKIKHQFGDIRIGMLHAERRWA
jgi:hypothetical protein